ncbi:hypothetical protein WNY77_17870 [Paraglaciecola mesophila]|uniref:Uncharacterized protein n=1 Tax=Paraglaciecola mesophila TaxID=197222 RepID=A0ABU9SZI4_9ALTE|tara:strand:- start:612 stop:815 length:204 start_codon:yes stop_codon:yes gene_type:complete
MKTHELARILLQYDYVDIVTNVGYTSMMAEDVLLTESMLKLQCLLDNDKKPEGVSGEQWLLIGGLSE